MENQLAVEKLPDILEIEVKFQPIVSVLQKSIIGLAGISLGANINHDFITLKNLFTNAKTSDCEINLDRLIREKVISTFHETYYDEEQILFINIHMNIIEKYIGSGSILELMNRYNINPHNVILVIYENNIGDVDVIKKFITTYRNNGFLTALTMGSSLSNIDSLTYIQPDIIIIDEAITKNIEFNFYKQEVLKSLVNLSKKISAQVVVDGINNEEQALISIELGADMLQGNYFGRYNDINPRFLNTALTRVDHVASQYINFKAEQIEFDQLKHKHYDKILSSTIQILSTLAEDEFDLSLNNIISKCDILECAYVLNELGTQVSDTATHFKAVLVQRSLIFKPAKKGADHSLKKYYYFLKNMRLKKYVTDEYLSLASGNLCITISEQFQGINNKKYILCMDFNPAYINR